MTLRVREIKKLLFGNHKIYLEANGQAEQLFNLYTHFSRLFFFLLLQQTNFYLHLFACRSSWGEEVEQRNGKLRRIESDQIKTEIESLEKN